MKKSLSKKSLFFNLKAFLVITNNSLLKNPLKQTYDLFKFLVLKLTSNQFSRKDSVVNICVIEYQHLGIVLCSFNFWVLVWMRHRVLGVLYWQTLRGSQNSKFNFWVILRIFGDQMSYFCCPSKVQKLFWGQLMYLNNFYFQCLLPFWLLFWLTFGALMVFWGVY